MKPSDVIHRSWHDVRPLLYKQPLLKLNTEILPNCRYTPAKKDIFNVFSMDINKIRVVILGQDPYPSNNHACGYAFATKSSIKPKSLRIIENEVLNNDIDVPGEIDLMSWRDQGVFLLNTALTCEVGKSGSHAKYWKPFMESVIRKIIKERPSIWLLWGKHAQSYLKYFPKDTIHAGKYGSDEIDNIPASHTFNYVLTAPHPIVEEYGSGNFYGKNHFYKTNRILLARKEKEIIW